MSGVASVVIGAVVTAAVSTVGDYLWMNAIPHGVAIYGLAHGVILFLTVGACLGAPFGKAGVGALGAALAGLIAAGSWYALQPIVGYWGAMFVLWFALWLMLGLLTCRVLRRGVSLGETIVRSVVASIGCGLAFYAVSGIWSPFDPQGLDYLTHFASWTIAYLPAFAALLVGGTAPRSSSAR